MYLIITKLIVKSRIDGVKYKQFVIIIDEIILS